jgi:hypothetical protein
VTVGWDLSHFNNQPGLVDVTVEYPVDFGDLPRFGGMFPTTARAEHVEWVDPFRGGVTAQASGSH